jgi:hypothetical protein
VAAEEVPSALEEMGAMVGTPTMQAPVCSAQPEPQLRLQTRAPEAAEEGVLAMG